MKGSTPEPADSMAPRTPPEGSELPPEAVAPRTPPAGVVPFAGVVPEALDFAEAWVEPVALAFEVCVALVLLELCDVFDTDADELFDVEATVVLFEELLVEPVLVEPVLVELPVVLPVVAAVCELHDAVE